MREEADFVSVISKKRTAQKHRSEINSLNRDTDNKNSRLPERDIICITGFQRNIEIKSTDKK